MSNDWIENTGVMPNTDQKVEVVWSDGEEMIGPSEDFAWYIDPPTTYGKIPNILKWRIKKEEKFLEDAYDVSSVVPTQPDKLGFKQMSMPADVSYIPQRVAEATNLLLDKSLTADDVELIVSIYKHLEK